MKLILQPTNFAAVRRELLCVYKYEFINSIKMPYRRTNAYSRRRVVRRRRTTRAVGVYARAIRRRAPVRRRGRTRTSSLFTARSRASFRRTRR